MKKIVYFLWVALFFPTFLQAQHIEDDMYFIPSKSTKGQEKAVPVKKESKKQVSTPVQMNEESVRDIDAYNRRGYRFERTVAPSQASKASNDTVYIGRRRNRADRSDLDERESQNRFDRRRYDSDLDGEWVTGDFDGSESDYEYATRIIRFRNPRFAISVSSPMYWDIVYGAPAWDWNVYTDGFYAYAFPTFSNPYWWNWRYGPYNWSWNYGYSWGCGSYYSWSYGPGYWHDCYYHPYYHHHHCGGPSWGGVSRPYYAGRSVLNANNRARYSNGIARRGDGSSRVSYRQDDRRRSSTNRVTTTRTPSRSGVSYNRGESTRRSSNYTRPSSTRSHSSTGVIRRGEGNGNYRRSSAVNRRSTSYTRGSSSSRARSSEGASRREREYTSPSRSGSSRSSSYSRSSSGSYSRSSGSMGGGRSSGGGRSGGGSRGGGSRR